EPPAPARVGWGLPLVGTGAVFIAAELLVRTVREPGAVRFLFCLGGGFVVGLVTWIARSVMPRAAKQKAALAGLITVLGAVAQVAAAEAYGGAAAVAAVFDAPAVRSFRAAPALAAGLAVVGGLLGPGAVAALGVVAFSEAATWCPGCGRRWRSTLLRGW